MEIGRSGSGVLRRRGAQTGVDEGRIFVGKDASVLFIGRDNRLFDELGVIALP